MRSSDLYLNYLQFARAFINRFTIVALLERDLNDACRRNAAHKEEETAAASAQAQDRPQTKRASTEGASPA